MRFEVEPVSVFVPERARQLIVGGRIGVQALDSSRCRQVDGGGHGQDERKENVCPQEGRRRSGTLGVQWARYRGAFGHPVIAGSLAAFECEIVAEYPAGDHHIILGRVQRLHLNATAYPLLYFRGRYQQLDDSGPDSEAHVGERGAVVDAAEQSVLPT